MDDILVATETFEEHLTVLKALFQRLAETGLTARPTKCLLAYQKLEFLGHTVSQGYTSPDPKNVEKLKQATRPQTKKDVRSFVSLCGFYQKYIKNFNAIAAPLTDVTKKGTPERIVWTAECEEAYSTLKDKLASKPILQLPDLTRPFILRTDASNVGIGATLFQEGRENPAMLFPVAYASKKLNQAQQNYSVIEKECLSLVWGVQKFQPYLYGNKFKVQSDHQPLMFLATSRNLNTRLMRWSLILQPYQFSVEYIPGKTNVGADFLSRHPTEEEDLEDNSV